jgi:hypothetical protein
MCRPAKGRAITRRSGSNLRTQIPDQRGQRRRSVSFYPRAREEQITPRCAKRRSPLRSNGRKRHAICSRRGGRLVQWTAGRRRSKMDSRLIVKTSPRFTVNWPALASSTLEDSGPVFTNRRCGAISPVRSVPDPPASTAPRAREDKNSRAWVPSLRRSSILKSSRQACAASLALRTFRCL